MLIHGKLVRLTRPQDEGNGYAMFWFLVTEDIECNDKHQVLCRGVIPMAIPGIPLEMEVIQVNGYIYDIQTAKVYSNTRESSLFFLQDIKGISPKTANMLLDRLDGNIMKLLDMDTEAFFKGIKRSKVYRDSLMEKLRGINLTQSTYEELLSCGLEYSQISRLQTIYEGNAIGALKKDPYSAGEKVDMDFIKKDFLARHYGLSRLSVTRMKSAAIEVLRINESKGNTRITIEGYIRTFNELIRHSAWIKSVSSVYLFAVINTIPEIMVRDGYLFFKRRYLQEYDIYKHLNRIKDIPKDLGITLNDVMMMEKEKGFRYLDTQRRLFSSMNKNNVILMPGKPGTGKTTTISGAIRLYKEKNPKAKVCMCAPTARASQVMKESSGYPASTIHSLLKLIPYGNDYLGKNENDQLECDLLIVDEMSMVDTEIFYLLLRAIPNGCQIILCGDPDQIESVGCGSVFRDLLNSNTFCTVTLNQFMRQEAQSSIVQNCKKILEGDPDLIADEQFFIGRYESDEAAKRALLYYYPKDEDCMKHQILSTTKQGKVGTEVLNRTLEDPADADSLIYHDYVYRAGDKVVFVSNNYKAGYCNGDVGVITEIHNGMTVSLGDETVSLGEYDLDEILPADVITVHKSQGGEYEDVYVMLPEKPRVLLTRNILNTAVSRARKKGYREEKGVASESRTETYIAMKLGISNWRWSGVPFYIRTGKQMPTKVTEIVVHFRETPHQMFRCSGGNCPRANKLILRLQPNEGIVLKIGMKVPGAGFEVRQVTMDFSYAQLGGVPSGDAYARLIDDCIQGDPTLFTRSDAVEASWKFFDPVLRYWKENPDAPLYGYPAGTWGPLESEAMMHDHGADWTNPCKNLTNTDQYCEL